MNKKITRCLCCILMMPGALHAGDFADTVLRGGSVYTVDAARSWAEAIAVRGNKIVYVGSDADVEPHIGPATEVIELEGRMVLPGFHDSHIHPVSAMLKSYMCNLRGLSGRKAYLEKVSQCVKDNSDSVWLMGQGWSHAWFDEDNRPDRKLLDDITTDIPITLRSYDGHSVWANSRAMELSGIDASTDDPPSGLIERYPGSRVPLGHFMEGQALIMIYSGKPDFTDEARYRALLEVQSYLNGLGITSIQDAAVEVDNVGLNGTLPAYRRASEEGRLNLRTVAALYWRPDRGMEQLERMKQLRAEVENHKNFRASSVKIWQDGVMHTHTSKLLEDYSDRPGERGLSLFEPKRLNEIVAALDREGFQVHIHADGDGALRESLDAFEYALEKNGRRDSRHQVAHLELVHPDDIPRIRELRAVANVQPLWSTSRYYIGDLINVKLGEKRKRWMEVNRSFLEEGITVAYGSDWFVTSPNPMDLIEAAVTRIRPALPLDDKRTAVPMLPGEEVTLSDAITSYTINGAYANHQDEITGSLEVGKLADIIVLDKNLFDVEPVRISETRVLLTFLGGRLVHGELPLEAILPADTTFFEPPTRVSMPAQAINGHLTLRPRAANSHIEVLVDTYGVAVQSQLDVSRLPPGEVEFVLDGNDLVPVQRGSQSGPHPYWEWIFEPGKAWDDVSAPGRTLVSLPFSLQERNQNCTHHGLMKFSISPDGSVSPVLYQVGSETCLYFKANLWGEMDAGFQPTENKSNDRIIDEHRALLSSRLPVKPMSSLRQDYPGIEVAAFTPPGPQDVTVFGLVQDGVHYRGGCETRFGPHPYCDWLNLPSYSTAKSVFAGLAFIYLEKNFPGFAETEVSDLVEECRLADGRWDGVTLRHLLNMTSGNYDDTGFEVDEGAAKVGEFFLPESHAEKIHFSCNAYKREAPPGRIFVYHTFDTYLLGTAMNAFIQQNGDPSEDIFDDVLIGQILAPLGLSPVARTTRRTYDDRAQPFAGYGLTWTPDDIARIGRWLTREVDNPDSRMHGSDFSDAMFQNPDRIKRLAGMRGEAYSNGFWGFDAAPWIACEKETWIPFMAGFGGNIVALMPNGSVYYYFSDGNRFKWAAAAKESNKILNYCENK